MSLEENLKKYRISEKEYGLICDQLSREPKGIEWALYSALWSEHCSYKSSKYHLKKLFSKSERVLQSFGENAGVIDLGQGERVAFKMESHNHPSFIEPYEGAATGVGGILRDIFTMGARPVALANYLCFGEPDAERMPTLVKGVVSGISGYGNCVGVPNISGQTEFHSSYNGNILVNAFALGLFRPGEKVFTSQAEGEGNLVVYVGAKTGRDGVHGASMASESFDDDNEAKKPNVQIGDPFFEKLLIESCIEVMEKGLVVAIQDMGAAGLTSSSFEMSSNGGVGFDISLDKVPLRDSRMTPEEILLSESQERMLLICEPKNLQAIKDVFSRWNLDATSIGTVTKEKRIRLSWNNEELCNIDPDNLVDNAPMYGPEDRPFNEWFPTHRVGSRDKLLTDVNNFELMLIKCLTDVRGCNRNWIFDQYDQRVGAQTISDCSNDVGVIRLPDSERALSVVLGCRPYVMRLDSAEGGKDSIAYPSVELASLGFEPLAVTDCLNFGNPEKKELMTEFVASVQGMSKQCEALKAPIISGNVSLYNETIEKNVTSTPSTGVVGLRDSVYGPSNKVKNENEVVLMLSMEQLKMSGQFAEISKQPMKACGEINANATASFIKDLRTFVLDNKVSTSKVVGKFGLAYTLARMCMNGVGMTIDTTNSSELLASTTEKYFAESLYQVVVCLPEGDYKKMNTENYSNLEIVKLGTTGGSKLKIDSNINMDVAKIIESYNSWGEHFETLA